MKSSYGIKRGCVKGVQYSVTSRLKSGSWAGKHAALLIFVMILILPLHFTLFLIYLSAYAYTNVACCFLKSMLRSHMW